MSRLITTQVFLHENSVNMVGGGMEIKCKHKRLLAQSITFFFKQETFQLEDFLILMAHC